MGEKIQYLILERTSHLQDLSYLLRIGIPQTPLKYTLNRKKVIEEKVTIRYFTLLQPFVNFNQFMYCINTTNIKMLFCEIPQ